MLEVERWVKRDSELEERMVKYESKLRRRIRRVVQFAALEILSNLSNKRN